MDETETNEMIVIVYNSGADVWRAREAEGDPPLLLASGRTGDNCIFRKTIVGAHFVRHHRLASHLFSGVIGSLHVRHDLHGVASLLRCSAASQGLRVKNLIDGMKYYEVIR